MKQVFIIITLLFFSCSLFSQSYLRITAGGNGAGAMPEIDPNAYQHSYLIRGLRTNSISYTQILNQRNAISGSLHYVKSKSEVRSWTYRWPSEFINGEYVLDSTLNHNYISTERITFAGIEIHHNYLPFKTFENLSIQSSVLVLFKTKNSRSIGRSESIERNFEWEEIDQGDTYNSVVPILKLGLNYFYRLGKIFNKPFLERIGFEISMGVNYSLREIKKDRANYKNFGRGGSLGLNFRLGDIEDTKK